MTLAGCARACKNDHPYVPYAVDDATSEASPEGGSRAASTTITPGDASPSVGATARVAPPNALTWAVDGLELVAPHKREFVLALVGDFDGDGKQDALAIVKPAASVDKPTDAIAAEIVYYGNLRPLGVDGVGASPLSAPVTIASVPSVPSVRADSTCLPVARLERAGLRTALVELGSACTRGASSRVLFVVRLGKDPSIAFELGLLDPHGAPSLSVGVDTADRDNDGLDDVTLRVTIEGGSPPFAAGPKLEAKVAFFDRSAGPSRDVEEPEASLGVLAALARARAGKSQEAASVPALVQQLRMLYRAMCVEGGTPRLVKSLNGQASGAGAVSCGSSKALELAGLAEVRAFVTQGDGWRAVAAASLAQLAPATKTSARTTELGLLLAEVAPFVQARSARVLDVSVQAVRAAHPVWGALAFEASGKLLVRGPSRVTRIDPESGESADATPTSWSAEVLSPDGASRWLEAYHACDGVGLRATFAPTGEGGDMRDVLLPVAPPLGSRCGGGRGEAVRAVPIAWTTRGLEAFVAGQPVLMRPESLTALSVDVLSGEVSKWGSPRSVSGRAIAIATAQGVLVKTTKFARYKALELEPYADLEQCTTNDDASRVACVNRSGRVVVAVFDPL